MCRNFVTCTQIAIRLRRHPVQPSIHHQRRAYSSAPPLISSPSAVPLWYSNSFINLLVVLLCCVPTCPATATHTTYNSLVSVSSDECTALPLPLRPRRRAPRARPLLLRGAVVHVHGAACRHGLLLPQLAPLPRLRLRRRRHPQPPPPRRRRPLAHTQTQTQQACLPAAANSSYSLHFYQFAPSTHS